MDFLNSADSAVTETHGDAFYWLLPLSRGGHCREVSVKANVIRNVSRDKKTWPLWRAGCCREVTVSRGSTVFIANLPPSLSRRMICHVNSVLLYLPVPLVYWMSTD